MRVISPMDAARVRLDELAELLVHACVSAAHRVVVVRANEVQQLERRARRLDRPQRLPGDYRSGLLLAEVREAGYLTEPVVRASCSEMSRDEASCESWSPGNEHETIGKPRQHFGGHSQIFTTSVSNACVFTGARECRIGVHTAFIDINAPRCATLLARAGGDLGRLSGDFKIVTGVCVGKSCVLRAKAACMLV